VTSSPIDLSDSSEGCYHNTRNTIQKAHPSPKDSRMLCSILRC